MGQGRYQTGMRPRVTAPGSRALGALQLHSPAWHRPKPPVSPRRPLCPTAFRGGSCLSGFPAQGPPLCAPAALRSSDRGTFTGCRSAACGPGGGTRVQQGGRWREGSAGEARVGSAPLSPPTGVSHLPYSHTQGRGRRRAMGKSRMGE